MTRRMLALSMIAATAVIVLRAGAADAPSNFLREHWRRPLPPQGPPPPRYTPVEASLAPEACGTCHPTQLADWKTTLHSRAMGPGVAGQLVAMRESDPETAVSCYACHAPLAEQTPLVRRGEKIASNSVYDPALHERGVVCAACHVRRHERFGPPKRDGSLTSAAPRDTLPHNGVTRTRAFLSSGFCESCHQFGPDGFALNGKPLEDTYAEWKASRFAREGVQCQDCHMPDRRHLWRGIHDPDMVRGGLKITVEPATPRARIGEAITAALRVHSTGVGHRFPTYVTPRVVLRGELVDVAGTVVEGSRQERVIERHIALDLSREISDTRLRPGEVMTLRYRARVPGPDLRLRFSVIVEPDAFYTRFFETLLQQGAGEGAGRIRDALEATRRSAFPVFTRELALR